MQPLPLHILHPTNPLPAQMLRKLRQARPARGVHVHMLLVTDILLVEMVDVDLLLAVRGPQQLEEVALEVVREAGDVLARVFADEQHLPHVRLRLRVAFEAVLVPRLLLAYLAVPAQALQAFGFELVVEVLGGAYFGAGHDGGVAIVV